MIVSALQPERNLARSYCTSSLYRHRRSHGTSLVCLWISTLLVVLAKASSRFEVDIATLHWIVVSPPHLPDFGSCELPTTPSNAGTAISRQSPVMTTVTIA